MTILKCWELIIKKKSERGPLLQYYFLVFIELFMKVNYVRFCKQYKTKPFFCFTWAFNIFENLCIKHISNGISLPLNFFILDFWNPSAQVNKKQEFMSKGGI